MNKKVVVIHSGGMDSSICLALAKKDFGAEQVVSLSFAYQQRHAKELKQAAFIAKQWNIDHIELPIDNLTQITQSALLDANKKIEHLSKQPPNTLVVGRNGLMAHLGGIYAYHVQANCIYMGIMELEGANSGYRDCSRLYMDLQQQILRIDLGNSSFEICTPLVFMTKKQTMQIAYQLGVLSFLLEETITCYEGIPYWGCRVCPACCLRNQGLLEFLKEEENFTLPAAFTLN